MQQIAIPKAATIGPKRPLPPLRQFTVDRPELKAGEYMKLKRRLTGLPSPASSVSTVVVC
eukprot:4442919-Amphidinium_carterae.2